MEYDTKKTYDIIQQSTASILCQYIGTATVENFSFFFFQLKGKCIEHKYIVGNLSSNYKESKGGYSI